MHSIPPSLMRLKGLDWHPSGCPSVYPMCGQSTPQQPWIELWAVIVVWLVISSDWLSLLTADIFLAIMSAVLAPPLPWKRGCRCSMQRFNSRSLKLAPVHVEWNCSKKFTIAVVSSSSPWACSSLDFLGPMCVEKRNWIAWAQAWVAALLSIRRWDDLYHHLELTDLLLAWLMAGDINFKLCYIVLLHPRIPQAHMVRKLGPEIPSELALSKQTYTESWANNFSTRLRPTLSAQDPCFLLKQNFVSMIYNLVGFNYSLCKW